MRLKLVDMAGSPAADCASSLFLLRVDRLTSVFSDS
jgi:hypothetical protein